MSTDYRPRHGDLIADTSSKPLKIGIYKGSTSFGARLPRQWWLRPIGGGIEWPVRPEHARPATDDEVLSARVAAENAASIRRQR